MSIISPFLKAALTVVSLVAAQASVATPTTVTLDLLPGSGSNVVGNGSTGAGGAFGSTSWGGTGVGKSELYVSSVALFGYSVSLSDIASISYFTNKSTPSTAVDWALMIYTNVETTAGNSASWYRSRLNAEPYLTQPGAVAANTWHEWSTGTAADSLRFFDQPRSGNTNFGGTNDQTLAALQAGVVDAGGGAWDYSDETVNFFSLQTGAAWANGFTGLVDGLTITLFDGSIGRVNLDAPADATIPEPSALALVGVALLAAGAARRRRAA